MQGVEMYELAKMRQRELRCEASRHRLVDSLPRRHSWNLGRYRVTVAKTADQRLSSSLR